MSFALIIFIRVLFVACMVFILGYIFGSFGKRPVLKTISRVAAILVIVLFIAMNILFMRAAIVGHRHHGPWKDGRHGAGWQQECPFSDDRQGQDSLRRDLSQRELIPQAPAASQPAAEGRQISWNEQAPAGRPASSTTLITAR